MNLTDRMGGNVCGKEQTCSNLINDPEITGHRQRSFELFVSRERAAAASLHDRV